MKKFLFVFLSVIFAMLCNYTAYADSKIDIPDKELKKYINNNLFTVPRDENADILESDVKDIRGIEIYDEDCKIKDLAGLDKIVSIMGANGQQFSFQFAIVYGVEMNSSNIRNYKTLCSGRVEGVVDLYKSVAKVKKLNDITVFGNVGLTEQEISELAEIYKLQTDNSRMLNIAVWGGPLYDMSFMKESVQRTINDNDLVSFIVYSTASINIDSKIIKNPIKNALGETVPIIETDTVKNVDAGGALDNKGGYIKFLNGSDSFSEKVKWDATQIGNVSNCGPMTPVCYSTEQHFFGEITFNYSSNKVNTYPANIVETIKAPNTGFYRRENSEYLTLLMVGVLFAGYYIWQKKLKL